MRLPVIWAPALLALAAIPRSATADWTVKRTGNQALLLQATRAFAAAPDNAAGVARLLRVAGRAQLSALLPDFQRRAESDSARYADVEAYARLQLLCGRSEQATAWFTRAAEFRADLPAPLAGRAQALKATGDRPGALAAFESALRLSSKSAERRQILEAMLSLFGDPSELEREVAARRELLRLQPGNHAVSDGLVAALARSGRAAEAAEILQQRFRGESGDRFELGLRVVELREAAGDDDQAAGVLAELLQRVPASASERRRRLWARTLEVERRRGRLADLAAALSRAPRAVEWDILSHVRDELGDPEGALVAARRTSALDPRDLGVRLWTVSLLERLGHPDDAIAEYEALARLAPRDVRFSVEVIERRFRRGQAALAAAAFDRSLAHFAGDPTALAELAQLASHWSDDQRAIAAWQRLRQIAPGDETAIVGLGELYFQRGKKESALRTWHELLRSTPSRHTNQAAARAHLRLAAVLMEHDLFDEATAQATIARDLEPAETAPHRTFAQILERQHRTDAAIAAWEKVLELGSGPERAGVRYEARARLLSLAARDGRGRLAQRVSRLEEQARQHPQDRELALFLSEAQQRSGNLSGAIATLRTVIERDQAFGAPRNGQADVVMALVRLLRQTKQFDEAVARLQRLATDDPSRAKEAQLQMADIELGRYDDDRALARAEAATHLSPGDAQALARIGTIQERAGRDEQARATYQRAVAAADGGNTAASLGLARLLQRQGNLRDAAQILRNVLRTTSEEDIVNEAGHQALDLEEYLGTREDFARTVAILALSGHDGSIYRRLFVDILRRQVPPLYRTARDGAAVDDGGHARMVQQGLRPLLESIAESDGNPDPALIELVGMLGNPDAAPVLANIAAGPAEAGKSVTGASLIRPTPAPVSDGQLAAVIALGRLRDERGRAALQAQATAGDPGLRASAIWALGRITSPPADETLLKAMGDANDDVVALACLGLGRLRDPRWTATLATVAREPARSLAVRRAAIVAMGLSADRGAAPALLGLLDSGAAELASTAAIALANVASERAVDPLLSHYLLGGRHIMGTDASELAALDRWLANVPVEDDGRAIEGIHVSVSAILDALDATAPAPVDRASLWVNHSNEIGRAVQAALRGTPDQRLGILLALDSRDDGIGLGPLAPAGSAALNAGTAEGIMNLGRVVGNQVSILVDDPDPEIRARALRVEAKLGSPTFPVDHIARIAASADQLPAACSMDAAAEATRFLMRRRPELAQPVADAIMPLLRRDAWEARLAAVRILLAAGRANAATLVHASGDPNPLVRAAANAALQPLDPTTD